MYFISELLFHFHLDRFSLTKNEPCSTVVFSVLCQPHRRRLTGIGITLRKNLFERGVVSVDVVVKMNESILRHDYGGIQD
jgi:hypothetical protein